jgi:hypothetical protein
LISILAPSLRAAKDLAKQMMCGANLHGLGTSVVMYGEANKAMLPPYTKPSGDNYTMSYIDSAPANLHHTYRLSGTDPIIETSTGKVRPYGNWSIMIYYGQIEKSDFLFCPSVVDNQLSHVAFPDPYGTKINTAHYEGVIIKCSFPANPNCEPTSGKHLYTKLEEFPTGKLLTCDPIFNEGWGGTRHLVSGEKSPTYQRLYPDTHVSARTSAAIYMYFTEAKPDTWNLWPDFLKGLEYVQD